MRVLFINGRGDADTNPGGDNVQMLSTKAALEEIGVTVEVRELGQLDDLPQVDLAHIFNIQMPITSWQAYQAVSKAQIPIVLSSIYWEMYDFWFDYAVHERKSWNTLLHLRNKQRLRHDYIVWQQIKSVRNHERQVQRRLLNRADRVLPNSISEALLLQHSFIFPKKFLEKIDVIPNGIDLSLYQKLPQLNQSFYKHYRIKDFALQVGTISPVKNQLGLLEALYDLPIPIVIIGHVMPNQEDYFEECKNRAKQRGNVFFIDHMPHNELPGIYALAAVHVLPSWRETPGLASLEAAASGCRIVTTSIGSTRDYFGDLAWYCYPDDQYSIRSAVEQALHQPKSMDLRNRVLSEYSWTKAADATYAAYEKALQVHVNKNAHTKQALQKRKVIR